LKARQLEANEIPVDIRAGSPGGDYPVQATLRLRSLYETMRFLAKGLGPEAEYEVDPDLRTGIIVEQYVAAEINPAGTFSLHSGDSPPSEAYVSTQHRGRYYWLGIAEQSHNHLESWNRGVFAMLHTLYQLNVGETVTKAASPCHCHHKVTSLRPLLSHLEWFSPWHSDDCYLLYQVSVEPPDALVNAMRLGCHSTMSVDSPCAIEPVVATSDQSRSCSTGRPSRRSRQIVDGR
jgi:hypothetical protein